MCNHYANIPQARQWMQTWREYVGWAIERPLPPELRTPAADVWPRRTALIVRNTGAGAVFDGMIWGVPLTVAGKRPGTKVVKRITNVRNLESPFWRSMLRQPAQRCLVPFSSFAEPEPGGGRAEIWFEMAGAPGGAFAGIWRASPEGDVFAFLTCEPNPLVAPVHPKAMPVILQPADYQSWLDGADAAALAQPYPSQLMTIASRPPEVGDLESRTDTAEMPLL